MTNEQHAQDAERDSTIQRLLDALTSDVQPERLKPDEAWLAAALKRLDYGDYAAVPSSRTVSEQADEPTRMPVSGEEWPEWLNTAEKRRVALAEIEQLRHKGGRR